MVSAAQRFGDFTTHLTYAYAEDKIKSGAIGNAQKFSEAQDSSITLGLRYDYSSSVAFKTEAHYITAKSSAPRLAELETKVQVICLLIKTPVLYTPSV